MKFDKDVLALSLLAAGESAHSLSAHMPSRWTTQSLVMSGANGQVEQNIAQWRSGFRPAAFWGLFLGGVVSVLAESPLPFAFSAGTLAIMIYQYESALPVERRLPLVDWPEFMLTGHVGGSGCSTCPGLSAQDAKQLTSGYGL